MVGNSPIKTGQVDGFAIMQADTVPIRLINKTVSSVSYSSLVTIKANLVLGEIAEETGATGTFDSSATIANVGPTVSSQFNELRTAEITNH